MDDARALRIPRHPCNFFARTVPRVPNPFPEIKGFAIKPLKATFGQIRAIGAPMLDRPAQHTPKRNHIGISIQIIVSARRNRSG